VDFVHNVTWKELLSRTIKSMHDWSSRVNTLCLQYDFNLIGHLVVLSKNEVNYLEGCGYKTRKEIYDVYKSYGLTMPNWQPGGYYEKKNYIFDR
jgi:ERCC4-type nuclease